AVKSMQERICSMKNVEIVGTPFEITSSMKQNQEDELNKFIEEFYSTI
ncbi:MAG TPA: flavodoxin, partial [Clostridiales bacterium]|nr:flavodoxin [Clostridiales bacterium]